MSEFDRLINAFYDPYPRVIEALEELPSIQPELANNSKELEKHSKELENKNGELISREEILKLPQRKGYAVNGWETYIRVSDIKELPSAQPETAKRIVGKSRDGMTLWYQCDMCNEPVDMQDNYCRGCGRRLIDE